MGPLRESTPAPPRQARKQRARRQRRRRRCLLKGCERFYVPRSCTQRYCSKGCVAAAALWRRRKAAWEYRRSAQGKERRAAQAVRRRKRLRECAEKAARAESALRANRRHSHASEGHRSFNGEGNSCCERPGCYVLFERSARSPCQRFCSSRCHEALRRVEARESALRARNMRRRLARRPARL